MLAELMAVTLPIITPRTRQPGGCCSAPAQPGLDPAAATALARVAKALADPVRLRIVDAVRMVAPEAVCQCEITPLFDISQPAISRHLRLLVEAGVLAVERRGLWAYYYVPEDSTLEVLDAWLS
jgi:ArsR family transcriptional regulator, arsenate/arsenite/antimonite-responsive transcriptional repressor